MRVTKLSQDICFALFVIIVLSAIARHRLCKDFERQCRRRVQALLTAHKNFDKPNLILEVPW